MSDAPAGPGWWQASDGRWYPPQTPPTPTPPPTAGWWQASDGRWYPPTEQPGTGPSHAAHAVVGAAPVAPRPASSVVAPARTTLAPAGDPPPADDVAPAGSPVGDLLVARSTAAGAAAWLRGTGATLARAEQDHGQDPSVIPEVATPGASVQSELPGIIDELERAPAALDELHRRRSAAARDLEQAEGEARAAKTKAIALAIAVVVVLLLVLVVL